MFYILYVKSTTYLATSCTLSLRKIGGYVGVYGISYNINLHVKNTKNMKYRGVRGSYTIQIHIKLKYSIPYSF